MRFRAADALVAGGLSLDRVRESLPRVDAERVWVHRAPRWFRALWGRRITAVALPWGIYVHPDRLRAPLSELGPLMVHELAHIEQWRRLGPVRWLRAYLGDYLRLRRSGERHHAAYRGIGLEVEARDVSRRLTD